MNSIHQRLQCSLISGPGGETRRRPRPAWALSQQGGRCCKRNKRETTPGRRRHCRWQGWRKGERRFGRGNSRAANRSQGAFHINNYDLNLVPYCSLNAQWSTQDAKTLGYVQKDINISSESGRIFASTVDRFWRNELSLFYIFKCISWQSGSLFEGDDVEFL